jgi:hypothetical protein
MKKITLTVAMSVVFFGFSHNGFAFSKDICAEIANSTGTTTTGSIKKLLRLTRTEDGLKKINKMTGFSVEQLKKIRATLLGSGSVDLEEPNTPVAISEAELTAVLTSIAVYYRMTSRITSEELTKNAAVIAKNANIPVWRILRFDGKLKALVNSKDFVTGKELQPAAVHAN